MRYLKQYNRKLLAVICLCMLLCQLLLGCGNTGTRETGIPDEETDLRPQLTITTADQKTEVPEATEIALEAYSEECRITQAGTYLLSGNLSGSIIVDAEEQIVHLILDNVAVESVQGSALQVLSAGKVILTLPEDSVSTLQDAPYYPEDTQADACIYSECDLTINGTGALNVHGYYKDAVHTKDVLKILGGSLFVQSKRDGLRGNDGVVLACQEATVQSERNGLSTTKTGKPGKGNLEILSGNYSVIGGNYAISCSADLYVRSSSLYLMGVVADRSVAGRQYLQEGSLSDG